MAEKNYAEIAKRRITRPADEIKLPKMLIYGRNKKGKTTFCTSAGVENTLIVDPEKGTSQMKVKNPHVWKISRWEDLADVYGYLRGGDHPYTWVCIDGLSRINDMALDYTMKMREERSIDSQPGMVQLKDWGQAGKVMKTMLVNFYNLDMGVIYTAQERPMETLSSEADDEIESSEMAFVADLPKGVRGMANSLVDVIGRIYVARLDGPDSSVVKQRRLWIGEHPLYDTGFRSEYKLPDYLKNPTVPKLIQLMNTGRVPTAKKKAVG